MFDMSDDFPIYHSPELKNIFGRFGILFKSNFLIPAAINYI